MAITNTLKGTLITITILLSNFAFATPCSTADYQTIVGGWGFEVIDIWAAVNSKGDILVGGVMQLVEAQVSDPIYSAFIYMLRTQTCEITWKHEFYQINSNLNTAVAWSHDERYAYMLGYSDNDSDVNYTE